MRVVARPRERAALEALLQNARQGLSGSLVLRGEPGIGKTTLLEYARAAATDFETLSVRGVESEMEIGFAGLHQLDRHLAAEESRLPEPQAEALGIVLGRRSGSPPDRFLVAIAVLTALSNLAEDRPLLCIVDDWQWIDTASADVLAFVARRLQAESIVLLIATRSLASSDLPALDELAVEGLSDLEAREVLSAAVVGPLDDRVRDRIVTEATPSGPLLQRFCA